MKIIFISHFFYPHIGGVEKHILNLSKELVKKGHQITVITQKHEKKLKDKEIIEGIKIIRITYPKIKFLGLLIIWLKLLKLLPDFIKADIIHIHDVFIWYLPLRFILFLKPVFTTFHGWEGKYPIPLKNILYKKIASFLSKKTICVGKYIEKYYKIKTDKIIYGASSGKMILKAKKQKNLIIFLGRLEKDTGILEFFKFLKKNKGKYKVVFLGDGSLSKQAENYGKVKGFVKDPKKYLSKAEYCAPAGYLSAIEGLERGCKLLLFYHNKLKKDYWQLSPFYKIKNEPEKAKRFLLQNTWKKLAKIYLDLWKS